MKHTQMILKKWKKKKKKKKKREREREKKKRKRERKGNNGFVEKMQSLACRTFDIL